jgi:predicted Zn-dependent peptidase
MKNKIRRYLFIAMLFFFLPATFFSTAKADVRLVPADKIKYPPLKFSIQLAERIELENGIVVFYMSDREVPLVSISATIRAGSIYDPPQKEGLAQLTAYLLRTGGTAGIKSAELDRRLDFLAASPYFSTSSENVSVDFSFLKSDMDECLHLLSEMMRKPAFEEEKIQLGLSQKLEELRRIEDNPQSLAFREFNRLLYPDDLRGRYATPASIKNIARADLISFHSEYYFPANLVMAVSGDLSRREAIEAVQKHFGSWFSPRPADAPAPPPVKEADGLFFIDKPLSQATLISGEFAASHNDPDFYAFSILDFIIGSGGFPSRIFSAVRNNEGLAYSAGSFYRARSGYGVFGTYAFTKTSSTLRAGGMINDILRDAASGSIKQDELDWAKKSLLNALIFSFETPHRIAARQMVIEFEKLPADYLTSYARKIEEVTLADLKRVARKYLKQNKRMTLILGDTQNFGPIPEDWGKPVFIQPLSKDKN